MLTLNIYNRAKQIYQKKKKKKKDYKNRCTTNFSSSRLEVLCKKCKKDVLKNLTTWCLFAYH